MSDNTNPLSSLPKVDVCLEDHWSYENASILLASVNVAPRCATNLECDSELRYQLPASASDLVYVLSSEPLLELSEVKEVLLSPKRPALTPVGAKEAAFPI